MEPSLAWERIPDHLRPGLARYLAYGIQPGALLTAVLQNDLKRTVTAFNDPAKLVGIHPIVLFLYWHGIPDSYGSPQAFEAWKARREQDPSAHFLDGSAWGLEPALIEESGIPMRAMTALPVAL